MGLWASNFEGNRDTELGSNFPGTPSKLRQSQDRGLGELGRPTWLAHLFVPIWRLMVEWVHGGQDMVLGQSRCRLVP